MIEADQPLPPLRPQRKTGDEPLNDGGKSLGPRLLDFWQWSTSNLVDNTLRGTYAEWLVATALGCADGARVEWGSYDLKTPTGLKVEVKSAAYLQSWAQSRYSTITFSVREAYAWDPETNTYSEEQLRDSDFYVFCLLAHKDQATVDPLDVDQWRFYVAPTSLLNRELRSQRTVGLATLEALGLEPISYHELASTISSLRT